MDMFLTFYVKLLKSVSAGFCLGRGNEKFLIMSLAHIMSPCQTAALRLWVEKIAYFFTLSYSLWIVLEVRSMATPKAASLAKRQACSVPPSARGSLCVTTESHRHMLIPGPQAYRLPRLPDFLGHRFVTEAGGSEGSYRCWDRAGQGRTGRGAGGYRV